MRNWHSAQKVENGQFSETPNKATRMLSKVLVGSKQTRIARFHLIFGIEKVKDHVEIHFLRRF